ncbi:hypothetical protein SDC9_109645 [bioreactor metagenome]|uniref:Uncharacterized protein n=1 Tax=bioreactor metagenome TaxID=1076179 RepID=A0A645BBS0_9ZZZZ
MALFLEPFDESGFVLRQHVAVRLCQTQIARHQIHRLLVIAGQDHQVFDTHLFQLAQILPDSRTHLIPDAYQRLEFPIDRCEHKRAAALFKPVDIRPRPFAQMDLLPFHQGSVAYGDPAAASLCHDAPALDDIRLFNRKKRDIADIFHNRLCQGMIGFLFDASQIRKYFFCVIRVYYFLGDFRGADRQGARFIKHHGIHPAEVMDDLAALEENAVTGSVADAGDV